MPASRAVRQIGSSKGRVRPLNFPSSPAFLLGKRGSEVKEKGGENGEENGSIIPCRQRTFLFFTPRSFSPSTAPPPLAICAAPLLPFPPLRNNSLFPPSLSLPPGRFSTHSRYTKKEAGKRARFFSTPPPRPTCRQEPCSHPMKLCGGKGGQEQPNIEGKDIQTTAACGLRTYIGGAPRESPPGASPQPLPGRVCEKYEGQVQNYASRTFDKLYR